MSAGFPDPFVPADTDVRDNPYMPLEIVRFFGSEFHALATDAEWRGGVTLWLKSYHQVPASSLPDDDVALARLAELGRDVRAWRKLRARALHGWVKCNDGRLYHPVVAEKVLEAWVGKLQQRKSSAAGNAKRHGNPFDPKPFDAAIGDTLKRLGKLNPNSRTLIRRAVKGSESDTNLSPDDLPSGDERDTQNPPTGIPPGDEREAIGSPDDLPSGSQYKGKVIEVKEREDPDLPVGTPTRAEDDDPFGPRLAERRASAAPPQACAVADPTVAKRELFARAEAVLGAKSGGQVTQLLRAKGGNVALARAALETASTAHRPRDYVAGVIRGTGSGLPPGQLYDRGL